MRGMSGSDFMENRCLACSEPPARVESRLRLHGRGRLCHILDNRQHAQKKWGGRNRRLPQYTFAQSHEKDDYFLTLLGALAVVFASGVDLPGGGVQPSNMLTQNMAKQQSRNTLRIVGIPLEPIRQPETPRHDQGPFRGSATGSRYILWKPRKEAILERDGRDHKRQ